MIEKSDLDGDLFAADVVWTPSAEDISRSNLKAFMDRYGLNSFEELLERSCDDVEWFTEAVLEFLDIRFQQPYSQILDLSRGIQFPCGALMDSSTSSRTAPTSGQLMRPMASARR